MANIFNLDVMAAAIDKGRQKAIELAGEFALNGIVGGHVLPPLPPFPESKQIGISNVSGYTVESIPEELSTPANSIFGTPMCFPLRIKTKSQRESEYWLLPVEPMITVGGGNTVAFRHVAKSKSLRGTMKERWNVDDYTISINGLFTKKDNWTYPKSEMIRLRNILEAREAIDVQCDLLEIFKIGRMVIEKYDFPFTKGEENQAFSISAYSDDDWDLFIKLDTL